MQEAIDRNQELSTYLNSDDVHGAVAEVMVNAAKQLQDAQSLLRLLISALKSSFHAGFHKVTTNLSSIMPQDWRDFTIISRRDDVILEKIVNNADLDRLLALRMALSNRLAIFSPVVVLLAKKVQTSKC